MRKVNCHSIELIGNVRAAWTARRPAGTKHEVINNELTAPVKQICERLFAARPVEHIVLLNLLPRQFPPLLAQFIAQPGKFFFFREKLLAGFNPLAVRHHFRQLGTH